MIQKLLLSCIVLLCNCCHGNDALTHLVNKERSKASLAPLEQNSRLNAAAQDQTNWMASVVLMSHTRGNQPDNLADWKKSNWHPVNRVINTGYFKFEDNYEVLKGGESIAARNPCRATVGENIAHGEPGSGAENMITIMKGWMNSKGHRDAILNEKFKEIGTGYTKTSDGHVWWCTVFGAN